MRQQSEAPATIRGEVRIFHDPKGYGFIAPEDGGKDIFVHYKSIQATAGKWRTLSRGDIVEFEVADSERGPVATNVRIVNS